MTLHYPSELSDLEGEWKALPAMYDTLQEAEDAAKGFTEAAIPPGTRLRVKRMRWQVFVRPEEFPS